MGVEQRLQKNRVYVESYDAIAMREFRARHPELRHYRERQSPLGKSNDYLHVWTYRYIPLAPLCECCPEDDVRIATDRHHPDLENYPEIIVSCCEGCHYAHHHLKSKLLKIDHSSKEWLTAGD